MKWGGKKREKGTKKYKYKKRKGETSENITEVYVQHIDAKFEVIF